MTILNNINNNEFDIAIIGGGIHGVGIAQAAAAAGYSIILLEKNDIGSGTSSKSSKLIHGGLRYLETGQYALVRECLKDRSQLLKLAPNLVKLTPFYIPVYNDSTRSSLKISLGLSLYALFGKFGADFLFKRNTPEKWLNSDKLLATKLNTIFQYWDAQTDDFALTRAVAHSAKQLGANILTNAEVTKINLNRDKNTIVFEHNKTKLQIKTQFVINASGPWVNNILELVLPKPPLPPIDLVQGTHILIDRVQTKGIYYLESPSDNRAVFTIPWKHKTLVGTTETLYKGKPDDVTANEDDINYLISIYNHYFPGRTIQREDVINHFSGLRVLPRTSRSAFFRKRDITLSFYPETEPGLVSIYGGKLTAYLSTAEKVVSSIKKHLPARKKIADPRKLKLHPLNSDYI